MTGKQQCFCDEYIIDLNATQAAIRAGYSEKTAGSQGERLLRNADIQQYVSDLKAKRSARTQVTADMVVKELASIGFANIRDFANVVEEERQIPVFGADQKEGDEPESVKTIKYKSVDVKLTDQVDAKNLPAIASIKQGKEGIELKLHDKVRALELLGKHLGVFEEDNKQKQPLSVSPEVLKTIADKINS